MCRGVEATHRGRERVCPIAQERLQHVVAWWRDHFDPFRTHRRFGFPWDGTARRWAWKHPQCGLVCASTGRSSCPWGSLRDRCGADEAGCCTVITVCPPPGSVRGGRPPSNVQSLIPSATTSEASVKIVYGFGCIRGLRSGGACGASIEGAEISSAFVKGLLLVGGSARWRRKKRCLLGPAIHVLRR